MYSGRSSANPADSAAAVVTSDSAELFALTRFLYIGGAGDVVVTTGDGDDVTFKAVPVGTVLPIRAVKVKATGTTATDIVAMW